MIARRPRRGARPGGDADETEEERRVTVAPGRAPEAEPEPGHGAAAWPLDRSRLRAMLANEADMAFRSRAEAIYEFLGIGPGQRVLDLGCGRGFYLNFTRHLYPAADVVGVELERPLLDVARRHVPGAAVVCASAYDLPFRDAAFDRVLFTEVIEHVPDDEAALAEIARVLRPGGVVALTTPHAGYPLAWDPINRVLEWLGPPPIRRGPLAGIWANHVRLYAPEDLARKAAAAGLAVEEVRPLTRWAFPFIHNLVYGLGKELLVAGLLPRAMADAADRFATDAPRGPSLNPVRVGLAALGAVDALNERFPPRLDRPFLVIAMKLRKPVEAV